MHRRKRRCGKLQIWWPARAVGYAQDCKFIAKKVCHAVTWSFVFLNAEVKAELDALPVDMRASFERIVDLVQAVGLERVHEPYIGQPQPALNLA